MHVGGWGGGSRGRVRMLNGHVYALNPQKRVSDLHVVLWPSSTDHVHIALPCSWSSLSLSA